MSTRYLNSAAAAEYLGLGTGDLGAGIIRQMVHRRQIPYTKIGPKRLGFDVKALDAWLAKRSVPAREEIA